MLMLVVMVVLDHATTVQDSLFTLQGRKG
ncbi:hypothetical protein A2U01_0118527, partial [Trifolium medium]|nr:hypothetical protein [Trifolium medium]